MLKFEFKTENLTIVSNLKHGNYVYYYICLFLSLLLWPLSYIFINSIVL
jgi:hypothetical protein